MKLQQRAEGNFVEKEKPGITSMVSNTMFERDRRTKNFFLVDGCTGCGLCASKCPAQAIEIRDGKPVWVKEQCELCLRCLHHCPQFAIQYGDGKTREHGQYRNPHVKV